MHGDGKNQKSRSMWKEKIWINSSLQIICWICISRKQARHPRWEKAANSVFCKPTNDECKFPNWKCVVRKCTVSCSIALPGVEIDSSNRSPMIMFNTYMTWSTCSHHGILIREKITTYLDAKGTSKKTCFLCEQLIQSRTPNSTRRRLYERVNLFSIQRKIGDFHKDFYIQKIGKLAYHRSYYKILGKHHVADVRHK